MKRIFRMMFAFALFLAGAVLAAPDQAEAADTLNVVCYDYQDDWQYVFADYPDPLVLQVENGSADETYTWELTEGDARSFAFVGVENFKQQQFRVYKAGSYTVSVSDSQGNTGSITIEAKDPVKKVVSMDLLEDKLQILGGDYVMAQGEDKGVSLMYYYTDSRGFGPYLDGSEENVTVTSDNPSVVQIVSGTDMILHAAGTGTANITVTSGDDTYTKAVTVVTAEEMENLINGFNLSEGVDKYYYTDLSMNLGQQAFLYANWDGLELNNGMLLEFYGDFTITSDNESVISVTDNYYLNAVAPGTANITVKGQYTTYTFPVQVLSEAQAAMKNVWLCDTANDNLTAYSVSTYTAYYESDYYGSDGVIGTGSAETDSLIAGYESLNPDILEVSAEGRFMALKAGEATLKIDLTDGTSVERTVLVCRQVDPVFAIRGLEKGIRPGETKTIYGTYDFNARLALDDFTDMFSEDTISIQSENPEILELTAGEDSAYNVSAKQPGTAVLVLTGDISKVEQRFTVYVAEGSSEAVEETEFGTLTLNKDSSLPEVKVPGYDEIAGAVFDEDDFSEGSQLNVEIVMNQIVPDDTEKALVESALAAGESAGMYLNINIVEIHDFGEVYGTSVETVTVLSKPVRFTITIPEELQGKDNYFVLREHDGVVERLEDLDDDPAAVTFETDRFSTYLLAYEGTGAEDPGENPGQEPEDPGVKPGDDGADKPAQTPGDDTDNPSQGGNTGDSQHGGKDQNSNAGGQSDKNSQNTQNTKPADTDAKTAGAVKTGDSASPYAWALLMTAAIGAGAAVVVYRRKKN